MLGISLLFVGFTLAHNGICILRKTPARTMAVFNLFTGALLLIINIINIINAAATVDFANAAAGFMFAFTYLMLAAYLFFGLDFTVVGYYGLFAAINALVFLVLAFKSGDWFMGALWSMWCILWASMFVENTLKVNLKKASPMILIAEGIFAAWIPAVYLLLFV